MTHPLSSSAATAARPRSAASPTPAQTSVYLLSPPAKALAPSAGSPADSAALVGQPASWDIDRDGRPDTATIVPVGNARTTASFLLVVHLTRLATQAVPFTGTSVAGMQPAPARLRPLAVPYAGAVTGHGGRVLRAGLTGGIGSGKSEVSRRLAAHGAVVIDADVAARAVVAPGTLGLARVAEAFGSGVLGPDGALDRDRLGAIVFADPASRVTLNSIVHPLVGRWMRAAEQAAVDAARGDLIVVHDVPLLAENRRASDFGLVIVVDVPPDIQLERLVSQRGMTPGQARARMAAQASREQRLAVADLVIDNSGSLADLDRRVAAVWADLTRRVATG